MASLFFLFLLNIQAPVRCVYPNYLLPIKPTFLPYTNLFCSLQALKMYSKCDSEARLGHAFFTHYKHLQETSVVFLDTTA